MNPIRTMTVGAKINSGYAIILGFLLLVCVIDLLLLQEITGRYSSISKNNLEGAVHLANAQDALWRLRYGFPQFLVLGAEDRAKIVSEEATWYKQIEENLTAYKDGERTPEEHAAIATWEGWYTKYRDARPHWFELISAGKEQEGRRVPRRHDHAIRPLVGGVA